MFLLPYITNIISFTSAVNPLGRVSTMLQTNVSLGIARVLTMCIFPYNDVPGRPNIKQFSEWI